MCGIIGIVSSSSKYDVAPDLYAGLWSLQHRGQESSGIVVFGSGGYHQKREMGTADRLFEGKELDRMKVRAVLPKIAIQPPGRAPR